MIFEIGHKIHNDFFCHQHYKAFNVAEISLLSGNVKTAVRPFALRVDGAGFLTPVRSQ